MWRVVDSGNMLWNSKKRCCFLVTWAVDIDIRVIYFVCRLSCMKLRMRPKNFKGVFACVWFKMATAISFLVLQLRSTKIITGLYPSGNVCVTGVAWAAVTRVFSPSDKGSQCRESLGTRLQLPYNQGLLPVTPVRTDYAWPDRNVKSKSTLVCVNKPYPQNSKLVTACIMANSALRTLAHFCCHWSNRPACFNMVNSGTVALLKWEALQTSAGGASLYGGVWGHQIL